MGPLAEMVKIAGIQTDPIRLKYFRRVKLLSIDSFYEIKAWFVNRFCEFFTGISALKP